LIDFFFDPKGIAVVGATPEPNGGRYLLANLLANLTHGYEGPIYPVNPKYDKILGLKCYSKVSEIKGPLDPALIYIPAQAVPQVLEDCIPHPVLSVLVLFSRGRAAPSEFPTTAGPDSKGTYKPTRFVLKRQFPVNIRRPVGRAHREINGHLIQIGLQWLDQGF
jgi:acyl-CoA synthetase (NDP forming)